MGKPEDRGKKRIRGYDKNPGMSTGISIANKYRFINSFVVLPTF